MIAHHSDRTYHYSRSPKVGNPIASVPKSNVQGIPALFGLNPVSNFLDFTIESRVSEVMVISETPQAPQTPDPNL